jgi:hypothetical protein
MQNPTRFSRPAPGPAAREWDAAAGRLAQHQAAFNPGDGRGSHPGSPNRTAYDESRARVEEHLASLRPTRGAVREVPSLGLSR